jgi:hypothetical protein
MIENAKTQDCESEQTGTVSGTGFRNLKIEYWGLDDRSGCSVLESIGS